MLLIRRVEETISELYRDGEVPGFVHLSIGQEASAVGSVFWLRSSDVITSTHRGHGHALAKGLDVRSMLAELMGRATGTCGGRGGSMHVAAPAQGIYGANGIVAAGLPIAVGAAQALAMDGNGGVAMAFFGDGAVAQGAFHESLNLAALWRLPVLFLCENNGYSEFSRAVDQHPVTLDRRAEGYGLPFLRLDGNDVEAVADAMADLIESVRNGGGPVLVEAMTDRAHGHYEGDQQKYRPDDERSGAPARDPLNVSRQRLVERGIATDTLDMLERTVHDEVAAALAVARTDPVPDAGTLLDHVYAPRSTHVAAELTPGRPELRYSRAVQQSLDDALASDPRVYLAGIDVGGGNVFGLTRGLRDAYPGRVLDTPISETAIMGLAVGSAMAGRRPVVELMYLDFLGVCLDQIMNQAAKMRFMTGGGVRLPLVIRTQFGSGRSSGSQHSQSLEALLAHIPGLTVVMPATPRDAYGLLRAAIDDDNPVVFIENRMLYERSGPGHAPDERVELGRARIARSGRDATIVAWSRMVDVGLAAARCLADEGIDAEVIDLRTIVPLDRDTILDSLDKTGRLVIAHDAVTDFGVGAEIAALAAREGFWMLDAPVVRVGAPYSPAPYAPTLEAAWVPDAGQIVDAVRQQVHM